MTMVDAAPSTRESLLEEAYARIFRYLVRLCRGDREEARELGQEAMVRVLRAMDGLRDETRWIPWTLRIASNVWRDSVRRRKTARLDSDLADSGVGDPAGTREYVEAVLRRVHELPELYRNALVLRYLEALDYDSMAEILECPVGTVRSHVARGLEMVRRSLKGEEP